MEKPETPITIDETNTTVGMEKAQTVADLVVQGLSFDDALKTAQVTRTDLGALLPMVQKRVKDLLAVFTVEDDVQKQLVKARLTEFLLSNDPDVAMHAIRETKKLHGMDQAPALQVQFVRPPEAERALRAVEESEDTCTATTEK